MLTFGSSRALTMDDLSALRQYANGGDPRAFEVLAARYQSMVLAICRRTLGNEADAEDATQETFLRLARHASTIKSNAAAWLHSCALNASKDVLRRKGAGVQAVPTPQHSLDAVPDSGEPETARLWRDIEPLLDAALADLSDEDRDVIVARFLVGRPLGELAKEAGVAAGTMHRRVDRALANLRQRLGPASLGISGLGAGDALTAVLQHGAVGPAAGPALSASVAKIGLSGIGATVVTTSATRGAGALVIAATLGIGTIGASAWYLFPMRAASVVAVAAFDPSANFERPTKATDPVELHTVSTNDQPVSHVRFNDDTIDFRIMPSPEGGWYSMLFDVVELTPGKPGKGVDAAGTMKARLKSSNLPQGANEAEMLHSQTLNGAYEIRGERLMVTQSTPEGQQDRVFRMRWNGRRWDESKPITSGPPKPADLAAYRAPAKAVFLKEPLLAGTWREQPPLEITISNQNITINAKGIEGNVTERYRIIEWTPAAGFARVQLIVARSFDPTHIGRRFKMLIRRDELGYTTSTHMWTSDKMDEWPSGFDEKKDPTLNVLTWKSEEGR